MDSFPTALFFVTFSIEDATEPSVSVPPSLLASSPTGTSHGLFSSPSLLAPGSTGGASWVAHLG
jgi:hypothetical protein